LVLILRKGSLNTVPRKYEIFNADAFEWLRERRVRSVHAVVTDPPYTVVEYSEGQLDKIRNGNGGMWRLPQQYDGFIRKQVPRFTILTKSELKGISMFHRSLAPLLRRVLVPGGHVFLASQNLLSYLVISEFVAAGFEIRGQVARIVKTLRGGDRPKSAHAEFTDVSVTPRSSWEPWLIFRRPCEGTVRDNLRRWRTGALRRPSEHIPFRDLISASPARNGERDIAPHPSLKPQYFLRQIVRAALPMESGIVLDPFMGSGSTIAAASALGLLSVGVELDKEYFTMAQRAIPSLIEYRVGE
jgi:DNA modification methylase